MTGEGVGRASSDEVDQEIARVRRELAGVREVCREAAQVKRRFLGNMGEELREPLQNIVAVAEELRENAEGDGLKLFLEPLDRVHRAGRHLLAIVEGILDIGQAETGQLRMVREDVVIADLLAEVRAAALIPAGANGNRVVLEVAEDAGVVVSDGGRLRQVLDILVSNACKFTQGGIIRLSAAAARGDRVEIRISDTGAGMTPDQQLRAFEEFSQINSSTTREIGGTGLGLGLCHRLVVFLGGGIGVESAPGRGSTFTVRLPRRERSTGSLAIESDSML